MIEIRPIRAENIGFVGEHDRYLEKLVKAEIPPELEYLKHQIPWPVDMENPLPHLVQFHGDLDFSDPEHQRKHIGIDIQNRYNAQRGFAALPKEVRVPDDVRKVYGRSFNHLHLDIITNPIGRYALDRLQGKVTHTDPLPLLRKLY